MVMPHILPDTGHYYPAFYSAFARSAQSMEMLQNALHHTDQKRQFVVCSVLFSVLSMVRSRRTFL